MIGKKWRPLRAGDIVDVVAPGFGVPRETVEKARAFLEKWKLVPRIPDDILGDHFLHANHDEIRARHLRDAWTAEDSAAVWCLRGGYGANRLLPLLARAKKPRRTKLFVGISDVTSLHVFLQNEWGWATLHGPLLDRLGKGQVTPPLERELKRLVFGETNEIRFPRLKPLNEAARTLNEVTAPIVGGNLIVLQSTLGTPWQMRTRGSFLFIEDLGERGYRIDRVLEHFHQAGALRGCRGILCGDFLGGNEPDGKTNHVWPVIHAWAKALDLPVFAGLEAGHADRQRPLPLAASARLTGGSRGDLIVSSGGLSR